MEIATWNVNSVNARLPNVLDWLKEAKPDVVCLQELKCEDERFPREQIEELGYNCLIHGQKTYNGVAILSLLPIEEEQRGLPPLEGQVALGPDGQEDVQARYLEGLVSLADGTALRVISVYCPNGNPIGTEKYQYKLDWMARLEARVNALLEAEDAFILTGDFNIIPRDIDCYDPRAWADDALFSAASRQSWRRLVNMGLTCAFMAKDGGGHTYSFWDYQGGAWQKDHGIRIDHALLSPVAADRLTGAQFAQAVRGLPKASDHVPFIVELA